MHPHLTNPRPWQPLDEAELALIDQYWRAANYLSVGQIYLLDNALLREPLKLCLALTGGGSDRTFWGPHARVIQRFQHGRWA